MRRVNWLVGMGLGLWLVGCGSDSAGVGARGVGGSLASAGKSSSCAVGAERCDCYGNQTCNRGLTCASGLCVAIGGASGATSISQNALPPASGGLFVGAGGAAAGNAGTAHSGAPAQGGTTLGTVTAGAPGGASATTVAPVGGANTGGTNTGGTNTGGTNTGGTNTGGTNTGGTNTGGTNTGGTNTGGTNAGATSGGKSSPLDLIILMDRTVSMSYAVGSESAVPASLGQPSRWAVMTEGMAKLAADPRADRVAASLTFFNLTGGTADIGNCEAAAYVTPSVRRAWLTIAGPLMVQAMQGISPSGLSPTVPALTGVYQYAMAEKQQDPTRDPAVVLVSDGFPTQCTRKAPSDVASIIKEAASAPTPIRTFIVAVGSPNTLDAAKFNLQNYAVAGNTDHAPFLLDETLGAAAMRDQFVAALLAIAQTSLVYP